MAAPRTTSRSASKSPLRAPERNGAPSPENEFTGPVRLGKRTKRLVKRLRPGDIAVIDHSEIDRVSGEDLVATRVRCAVNCSRSASPCYGNPGPVTITAAGIHLVDMPAAPL